ncbi:relaxase/mobilization nuclease [Streptomyces mobaraensis]|uniref:relaxase/mobilization nuclease n=1 Tax=Streptomyces mobaraensis TaxID=35621 RepID=UPI0033280D86
MIARVTRSSRSFTHALDEAIGHARAVEEDLTDETVLAHSPVFTAIGAEGRSWSSTALAEYLAAPARRSGYGPHEERPFVFHLVVRPHPGERRLTRAEWAQVARRLAHAAGLAPPGDGQGCRWIALQDRPGRLHLLASLVREDGTRVRLPQNLPTRLVSECRRITSDLQLHTAGSTPAPPMTSETVVAGVVEAELLRRLAEESGGPLAAVRRQVEQAAYRVAGLPDGQGGDAGRRLEWVARRLYALQEDLNETAVGLDSSGAQLLPSVSPAPVRAPGVPVRRSR